MQCPQCRHDQKKTDAKKCEACGYRLPLAPEEEWALSDEEISKSIDKYCDKGELYFTHGQLYSIVYKAIRDKYGLGAMGCFSLLVLITLILPIPILLFSGDFKTPLFLVLLIVVFLVWEGNRKAKKPGLPANIPEKHIAAYKKRNKLGKLVHGSMFNHLTEDKVDRELVDFAPERVLVVESEEMVDMLLLNRFHFENKALVLSSQKYPGAAFAAYRHLISNIPDIPVMVLHDCSYAGLRIRGALLRDKEWALAGKRIIDLGLLPKDVGKNSSVPWLPADLNGEEEILQGGSPEEYLEGGYGAPVSGIYPRTFIPALTLAVNAGVPLFSKEYKKKQKELSKTTYMGAGGFG